jgi:hypothetical protein
MAWPRLCAQAWSATQRTATCTFSATGEATLKALFVDRHGYCMLVKRLSRGRFRVRVADQHSGHVEMEAKELATLLSELSFVRERTIDT